MRSDEYKRVALVDRQIESVHRGKNKTPYDAPDAERDANARLICAAPDLLAACEAALNDRMYKDWPQVADLMKAAIKKAKNE